MQRMCYIITYCEKFIQSEFNYRIGYIANCSQMLSFLSAGAVYDTLDVIDPDRCIKYMRCVAVCHTGVWKLDEKMDSVLRERLTAICGIWKANEPFL